MTGAIASRGAAPSKRKASQTADDLADDARPSKRPHLKMPPPVQRTSAESDDEFVSGASSDPDIGADSDASFGDGGVSLSFSHTKSHLALACYSLSPKWMVVGFL